MRSATSKGTAEIPDIHDVNSRYSTPQKEKQPVSSTPIAINTPRIENRPLTSTPEFARVKTGLAKKLEMAVINTSIKNSPLRLEEILADAGTSSGEVPATPGRTVTAESPRKSKPVKTEFPSLKPRLIVNPRTPSTPMPQRPIPAEVGSATPQPKPADDRPAPPSSPRKAPMAALSGMKNKVEDLVSPKARLKHLFEDVEWVTLTNSRESRSAGSRFSDKPIAPESPSHSPLSGAKRKATDDPEPRDNKRVRFAVDDYSKASESEPMQANENADASFESMKKIDQLIAELCTDYPTPRATVTTTSDSGANVGARDPQTYPFKTVGLGKAVLKARGKGQPWVTPAGSLTASESLRFSLNQLRESNRGKIDDAACAHLDELFSLLPAGAIAGTEVFRKGLNRSIRELALDSTEWSRIEALQAGFGQLDISRNPESLKMFRDTLNYIVAVKNMMALQQQGPQS